MTLFFEPEKAMTVLVSIPDAPEDGECMHQEGYSQQLSLVPKDEIACLRKAEMCTLHTELPTEAKRNSGDVPLWRYTVVFKPIYHRNRTEKGPWC